MLCSGYTAENLADKGVHEVSQRRFVLVSADHPIVSAISENAEYAAHTMNSLLTTAQLQFVLLTITRILFALAASYRWGRSR